MNHGFVALNSKINEDPASHITKWIVFVCDLFNEVLNSSDIIELYDKKKSRSSVKFWTQHLRKLIRIGNRSTETFESIIALIRNKSSNFVQFKKLSPSESGEWICEISNNRGVYMRIHADFLLFNNHPSSPAAYSAPLPLVCSSMLQTSYQPHSQVQIHLQTSQTHRYREVKVWWSKL